jgi:FAD dependent oxidoreductase
MRPGTVRSTRRLAGVGLVVLGLCSAARGRPAIETDICIYGGTVAGVAAAVQSARLGKTAVIAEFGNHLGGMTSGGLGATDIGNKAAIGGIAREFYHRIAQHYAQPWAWQLEKPEHYFNVTDSSAALERLKGPEATMWTFEPHVAEDVLFSMANAARVSVYLQERLASVGKRGKRIQELRMENGRVYRARMFIDATYEGDLMARAGVSYTIGREANLEYQESLNGIREQTPKHQFLARVDPYKEPGNATSGLLPFVQGSAFGQGGEGDRSVQAYNFRLCYTRTATNRLPHVRPANYDPARYELLARYLEALVASGHVPRLEELWNPIAMPNGKTDINNNGGFSTDFIGANSEYSEGSYEARARVWQAHKEYILGFVYFLATDFRVPAKLREELQGWGPAGDEFLATEHWPHQLYVREARRMVSDYVMTEHNCRGETKANDAVGLAAYTMDSHNCRRVVRDGSAENEGDVQVGGFPPYPISYRSIVPKSGECENLLVPVCLSATHIAYGSIRMEPVFMILGQSAATAASFAIEGRCPVQRVGYEKLRPRLLKDRQILEWPSPRAAAALQRLSEGATAGLGR